MYDGNPLDLDRLLEKLDDWEMTVTEDMCLQRDPMAPGEGVLGPVLRGSQGGEDHDPQGG